MAPLRRELLPVLCVAFACSTRVRGDAPSIEDVRAINTAQAYAIDNCKRLDRVVTRTKMLPGESERVRSNLVAGAMERMDTLLARLHEQPGGPSPRQLDAVRNDNARRLAAVDGLVLQHELNKSTTSQRKAHIDFVRGLARYDVADLRDLEHMRKQHKLSVGDLRDIDRTETVFINTNGALHIKQAELNAVAYNTSSPRIGEEMRVHFGIIPGSLFDGHHQVSVMAGSVGTHITIEARDRSTHGVTVIHVQPRLDYLASRITRYDEFGQQVERIRLSNLKRVGGVLIPFRMLRHVARNGVPDYVVEESTLLSIDINVALRDDIFQPPRVDLPDELRSDRVAGGTVDAAVGEDTP